MSQMCMSFIFYYPICIDKCHQFLQYSIPKVLETNLRVKNFVHEFYTELFPFFLTNTISFACSFVLIEYVHAESSECQTADFFLVIKITKEISLSVRNFKMVEIVFILYVF